MKGSKLRKAMSGSMFVLALLVMVNCQPDQSRNQINNEDTDTGFSFGIGIDSDGNFVPPRTHLRMGLREFAGTKESVTNTESREARSIFNTIGDFFKTDKEAPANSSLVERSYLTRETAQHRSEANNDLPISTHDGSTEVREESHETLAAAKSAFDEQLTRAEAIMAEKSSKAEAISNALRVILADNVRAHNQAVQTVEVPLDELVSALSQIDLGKFKTTNVSREGNEIRRVATYLNYAKSRISEYQDGTRIKREDLIAIAEAALIQADSLYAESDLAGGDVALEMAEVLLDASLNFVPGVSWVNDVYQSVTGKSVVTGEQLSEIDRTFAVIGLLSGGILSKFKYGGRFGHVTSGILRAEDTAEGQRQIAQVVARAEDVVEAAKKIGLDNGLQLKQLATTVDKSGVRTEKLTETLNAIGQSNNFARAVKATPAGKPMFYVKLSGEAIPAVGYRHFASEDGFVRSIINNGGKIPAYSRGNYVTFNKFESAAEASSKLQVPHDAAIRMEFDTLHIVDELKVPRGKWGEDDYLEPITSSMPQFGEGGATQAVTNGAIQVDQIVDLKTGEILFRKEHQ